MKPKEINEKLNLNQTQPFNINSIELYRKFSMPNLFSSNKKEKQCSNINKKIKITRIDSSKTIIDSANKTLLNTNKNFQNSKIVNYGHDNNNTRKINIKKSTQMFNYFYDNEKSDINKEKNKLSTNISNNIDETVEHKLLYEDIIKMKYKINRLNKELLFLKSTNRKKDDEIRELENYQEEAKYYFGKKDNNIFYKRLEMSKEIIKLKNKYESIKIKYQKQKEINDDLIKHIKLLNLAEINNINNENKKILLNKTEELTTLRKENEELENKLINLDWVKNKYEQNHNFVLKIKLNINKKISKINKLKNNLQKLEDKYKKIKTKQNQILRRNLSIIGDNKKLLDYKKYREEYVIKQTEIEKQISIYEMKTRNLINDSNDKENIINDYLQQNNTEWRENNQIIQFNYKPILEENPNEIKDKNVILYESLIQESKKKQNELKNNLMILIGDSKNKIKLRKNISKNLDENNNINNDIKDIIENDNSQLFSNIETINGGIKEINIEDHGEITKKNNDFIFLLNVLFYIKNISQEKIQNILLNFKTEKYYIGNINKKEDFLNNLSTEILRTINNINDVNNMKEVLLFLLDNKYQGDNILFLDKVINDIYILNDNKKILINDNEEKAMLEKIRKIFSENNNSSLIEKINKNKNRNTITYDKLKSIIIEEKIFKQIKDEEMKLFQFFIYHIKKSEKITNKNSLNEFSVKIIMNFINELNKDKKDDNNFIVAFKNFLENKNITLEDFLGNKDIISVTEFMNLLNKNEFKVDNINLDIYCALQKYQTEENYNNISVNKLRKDINNI